MADNWDAYIQSVQNGVQPTTASKPQGSFLQQLFASLLNKNTGQGAGPGQVPKANGQGLYTPGLNMAPAGPSTPINYAAIKNLLNSGVLKTGTVPTPPQEPTVPMQEAAPEQPKKSPLDMLFSSIFGGFR